MAGIDLTGVASLVAALGGVGTLVVTSLIFWRNAFDRKRALIDALSVWIVVPGSVSHANEEFAAEVHVMNGAPTPIRNTYVYVASGRTYDDGVFQDEDSRVRQLVEFLTLEPGAHAKRTITLSTDPRGPVPQDFKLRVAEFIATDNTGRIWKVSRRLNKAARAKPKKRVVEIVRQWRVGKHEGSGFSKPEVGKTEVC